MWQIGLPPLLQRTAAARAAGFVASVLAGLAVELEHSSLELVMKRLLSVAGVAFAVLGYTFAAAPAFAAGADLSGTWTTQTEVQGIAVNETCVFVQAPDGALSGSCDTPGGKFKLTGKVHDKGVNFTHPAAYQGEDMTVSFFGTLNDDKNISGSIDMQPINAGGAFAMVRQSK
jgi:hypothetical protein